VQAFLACVSRFGNDGQSRLYRLAGVAGGGEKAVYSKYFSLLPAGAKPPVDLNKDIMDKYRPAMRKFYLNTKAEFK
jgi:hypothetical protein